MTLSSFVPGSAPCILAGDFNCVPDTQLDRMSIRTSSGCSVGMSELDLFIKNHDMVDVWRAQHPGLSVFTWHRPDGTDASRLDRVYSPSALSPSDCEVVTCQVPRQGGLGLVHFPSKLRFLLTKCVFSAVESQMPFAYFVRYWGGLSFRWFFPTLFSNSVPHSWRPTKAYSQMRETLRIMSAVGDVLQSSAGDQYRAIFDDLVGQVQPNDYASGPEVWRVVHSGTLDHRRRDLLWRIAHDAIVTNLKRLRWRLGDGICPRTGCTGWESVPHVFWQCGFVALLWEWFQALADRLTFCNTWAVSQDYALYGLSPPPCNTSAGLVERPV
ncbi:hypothetical protein HOLleu_43412 [Holothuria leucospilota]|uniref:Endonuclease/exonuclease/phosphatase domain-containing protein n=1 Tax=Holothuria leucospilota TaxID=206669 RepID=A0A9Q1BAS2_HOLLE|nr:hypothetical protein HOLleu_43412 [Holothuria leucospilota]